MPRYGSSSWAASRASSWAASWLAALSLLGVAPSCQSSPRGCDDVTSERCLWNQGLQAPVVADKEPGQDDFSGDPNALLSTDARLEDALTHMVDMMRAGLEWSLVNQRARTLCTSQIEDDVAPTPANTRRERKDPPTDQPSGANDDDDAEPSSDGKPTSKTQPDSDAWHCDTALMIDSQSLQLEATAGVLSLSAALDQTQSAALHELTRARFEPWCAGKFEELEGINHLMFYRCALPEGPYLVIARFPHDLEADEWQVTIAILDAG